MKYKSLKDENQHFLKLCDEFYEKWHNSEKEVYDLKGELQKSTIDNENIFKLNFKLATKSNEVEDEIKMFKPYYECFQNLFQNLPKEKKI